MKKYDAIIIGAGQAGGPLAKKMAEAGMKTALIEKRWVGGTCVNDGCTPTKTMIASAKAAWMAGNSAKLGIDIPSFTVNMPAIKKRKDDIVIKSRAGNLKGIEGTENLDLIFGEAKFTAEKTISVALNEGGIEELHADLIFIDTGTKTMIPDIAGLNDIDYLTSTSIMELEKVPGHLLILGGNYIGLEFGQMFRRFGSKVTILEKSAGILSREDKDISDGVTNILEAEDINIITNATAQSFKTSGEEIIATVKKADKEIVIECTHVLVAIGRIPQSKALNLEAAGIKTDDKGNIIVNDKLETNVKGIYAMGDVKGGPAFTHIAYNDYTIVYRNLLLGEDLNIKDRPVPYCMFTDPELGRVGLSEHEAKKKGLNYKVAILPMEHVARAIETGDTRGFMKAIVDTDTKQILGAAILGQQGGEIMTVLQMAMLGGITYDRIRYCVIAHPLYAESLNNLFMSLDK